MKLKKRLFKKNAAASDVLEDAVNSQTADKVSLGELMQALHERGFGLLMLIVVLPNCVPIPIPPGGSTLFSIPLLFLAVQMLVGMESPWLPKWLSERKIERKTLAKAVSKASPKLKKVEKLLKPRFAFANSAFGEKLVGFFWLIFAVSIAVPLPMTNFLPGIGILLMSLGLLSKDGLFIISGILVGLFGVFVTVSVLLVGKAAVLKLFAL